MTISSWWKRAGCKRGMCSVAREARKYGVNANQVFQWRTLYRKGGLGGTPTTQVKLLPVSVAGEAEVPTEAEEQAVLAVAGIMRIKLAGHASISVEGSVDPELIRGARVLAPVIDIPAGTRIWIAAGVTVKRRGFQELSAQVQTVLEQQPYSGRVLYFEAVALTS